MSDGPAGTWRRPPLAWGLFAVIVLAMVGAVWLVAGALGVRRATGSAQPGDLAIVLAVGLFVVITGATGALVASRLPRHPIGWLLLVSALGYTVGSLAVSYGELALSGGSLPAGPVLVYIGDIAFGVAVGVSATFVLLLFPTGHLPSRRWRPAGWLAGIGLALTLIGVVLSPELFAGLPFDNPVETSGPVQAALEQGGLALLTLAVVLSVGSLVARYRRARGVERQQLKVVAFAAGVLAATIVGLLAWEAANGPATLGDNAENFVTTVALSLVPVAIGIAILRYGLYEIDRIITRTLSYGAVSAVLLIVYAGVAVVPAVLFDVRSDLLVAAATLAAAGVFQPLRRRVQASVDRRFNRTRYDAVRTVDAFVSGLRDRTDLGALAGDLTGVVHRTVQPAHATVWLRAGASR